MTLYESSTAYAESLKAGTIVEPKEQLVLARIRTLLAVERNLLAEERTALARFRTGLLLALIVPPASSVAVYMLSIFPVENTALLASILSVFFLALMILGLWMIYASRSRLKRISREMKLLKERMATVIRGSPAACDLLGDIIVPENK